MFIKILISGLLSFVLMSGCTVVGAGVVTAIGGTHYLSGEIKSSYATSIYQLYEATLYSFKMDGLKTSLVKNTKTDADIEAKFEDGTKVKVHIYYNKEGYATLGVRVGTIGDERRSRELVRSIERYI